MQKNNTREKKKKEEREEMDSVSLFSVCIYLFISSLDLKNGCCTRIEKEQKRG